MNHIIMSGPIKPATAVEEAAARARRNIEGGGRLLSHPFDVVECAPKTDMQLALERGFIRFREAGMLVSGRPWGGQRLLISDGWRKLIVSGVIMVAREDVELTIERLTKKKVREWTH